MSSSERESDARIAALESAVARLTALLYLASGRITALEDRSGVATSETPPLETTIKDAAFQTGFSQTQIRKLIAQRKIAARQVGGRWLIGVASLPRRCEKVS